jgi:hypothetical protein
VTSDAAFAKLPTYTRALSLKAPIAAAAGLRTNRLPYGRYYLVSFDRRTYFPPFDHPPPATGYGIGGNGTANIDDRCVVVGAAAAAAAAG